MRQYEAFRREQEAALKKATEQNSFQCRCGSVWFEAIQVHQIYEEWISGVGQKPPVRGPAFYLMRCIKCGDLNEPPINRSMSVNDPSMREYDKLLDMLEEEANEEKSSQTEDSSA